MLELVTMWNVILKNQALTSIGYGLKIKIRGHILAVNPIKLELMGPTHTLAQHVITKANGLEISPN